MATKGGEVSMETLQQMLANFMMENKELHAKTNEKIDKTNRELKEELSSKIDITNQELERVNSKIDTKIDQLECKFQTAMKEHELHNEKKFKEYQKQNKEMYKEFHEHWDEKFNMMQIEQEGKIQELSDSVTVNVNKTCELANRTTLIEAQVHETKRIQDQKEEEISYIKEDLKKEVDKLRTELRKRPAQMMVYPGAWDDRLQLTFAGNRSENPIEFLTNCERELEQIGNEVTDEEKIHFITRHFKDSAAQWYTIIRESIKTYEQFKESFENRYWNIDIQRQVRDQLEYGKFQLNSKISMENYAIRHIEKCKHLQPKFTQYEIISKLAYHFNRNIQLAVFTQGIKSIEQFLILITQLENINKHNTSEPQNTDNFKSNYHNSQSQFQRRDTQKQFQRGDVQPHWRYDEYKPTFRTADRKQTEINATQLPRWSERYAERARENYNEEKKQNADRDSDREKQREKSKKGGYSWPNTSKKFTKPYERPMCATEKDKA